MKLNMIPELSNQINENAALRKVLLEQEGGIMKYWAEHPDTDGLDSLRCEYRKECAKAYREENKWEMSEADMAKRALGWWHIANESDYLDNLKEAMATAGEEVSNWRGWVSKFTLDYLGYAYKEYRAMQWPDGQPAEELYGEFINMFKLGHLAMNCLNQVLIEHRGYIEEIDFITNKYTNLKSGLYFHYFFNGTDDLDERLREAVSRMLQGKTNEECRQMAKDELKKVINFSRKVYPVPNDNQQWYDKELADIVEKDKEYLFGIIDELKFSPNNNTLSENQFTQFANTLSNVGSYWAAQLLVRGIDMHDLENETGSMMHCCMKYWDSEYWYYVDILSTDEVSPYIQVESKEKAAELLAKIKETPGCTSESATDYQTEPPSMSVDVEKVLDAAAHFLPAHYDIVNKLLDFVVAQKYGSKMEHYRAMQEIYREKIDAVAPVDSGFRFVKGERGLGYGKVAQIIKAMYDLGMFKDKNGNKASSVQSIAQAFGKPFGYEFPSWGQTLREAFEQNNYLEIFNDMEEAAKKYKKSKDSK